jgi:hypothetical protein
MLHPRNPDFPTATLQGLRFTFLAIEFKAAGGMRGGFWVAQTNVLVPHLLALIPLRV